MFFIPIVPAGHPLTSGYPHQEERRPRKPPRKHAENAHGDVVQISAEAYELVREAEAAEEEGDAAA